MTIVEALKELVLAYGGSASDGETVVDVLKDVTTAMGGSDTAGETISDLIADITATVESGGGGGSSDFSYANVTLVVTGSENDEASLLETLIKKGEGDSESLDTTSDAVHGGESGTSKVVLFNGSQSAYVDCDQITSVSGDITETGGGYVDIEGNGTITVVGKSGK